ncbi:AraC family transcriptional regulator [Cellulophaga sp. Hel_I_12]|uniref:AraC family transcriptional regulator n=1 Tax=Cellulophaga sp. Hel_I_12 TaxID=1249972 RepID=UPI000647E7BD
MVKARPFKIAKKTHESITVQVDKTSEFYSKLHQHEEIQISYIKKGKGKLIIADSAHSFKEGALFCIGSNHPHVFKSSENSSGIHMISLFFTRKSFEDCYASIPELAPLKQFFSKTELNFKVITNTRPLYELIEAMVRSDKLSRLIQFFQIIQLILNAKSIRLSEFKALKKITDIEGKRMQVVFDYVIQNFQNQIGLNDVADLIYMTPNAFCRFFKQRTNKTFFQFLIQFRIEHACQLLENTTDNTIENIAMASGFNSVSNFNRQFKTLKSKSPSRYAKN